VDERPWHRFYAADLARDVSVPEIPLQAFLRATAAKWPHRTAVILGAPQFAGRLSYRALDRSSDRLARALIRLGVHRGDRVAVSLPNLPQTPIAVYGVLKAGATLVQVNPLYRGDELAYTLSDSQAGTLITLTRLYPHLEAIRQRTPLRHVILTKVQDYFPPLWRTLYTLLRERREGDAMPEGANLHAWRPLLAGAHGPAPDVPAGQDDLAVLQYTGGTTGLPRGAMLSHRNLVVNAAQALAWFKDLREGGECFLTVVPLFHAYGLLVLNAGVRLAATHLMVLMRLFDARLVAEQVPRHHPTIFPGVPAMYVAINHLKGVARYNLHSIRMCLSGAAGLPAAVADQFERLSGGRLVEGYGLTEASPLVAANPIWQGGIRKDGSIGIPVPSTDARIVDIETGTRILPVGEIGELVIQGPQVMRGYWNAPQETADAIRDGWLFTGDIARMDEDGFIFIVDRKKDMIDVGGLKVYPREIEDLLLQHPLVRETAVVGVPHAVRGETIVAQIILRPEAGDPGVAKTQIREFLRSQLPAYKIPRRIDVVDAIPKTLVGKPLRRVVRAEAAQHLKAEVSDSEAGRGDAAAAGSA
jgi:long-chain acyl-CoA synthetase